MGELLANAAVASGILLAGLSILLMVVGLISYSRVRHARLLGVAIAFGLFAAQGIYFAWDSYQRRAEIADGWGPLPTLSLMNLGIVLVLYLAVLKS